MPAFVEPLAADGGTRTSRRGITLRALATHASGLVSARVACSTLVATCTMQWVRCNLHQQGRGKCA